MKPIRVPTLTPEQLVALEEFYRTPKARLRTRAQMVLLAAERGLTASEIAEIVPQSEETVRRWLKRYLAEGVEGLRDAPQPGAPRKVTEEYRQILVGAVRRRPRSLGLPFSLWTLHRLADYTWPREQASGSSTAPRPAPRHSFLRRFCLPSPYNKSRPVSGGAVPWFARAFSARVNRSA
jgi:transposase